ncbi:MAG: peptide chain release factor N(5)-glutamine methyltransferase [Balneolales bacterium]|nr:peptide chain release factor N(5)-glutamine methyltransferase [Balneolales bacterium]
MSQSNLAWTVLRMLQWGTDWFTQKGVDSPRLSIEWLVADVLQIRRLNLYVQFDRPLSTEELDKIRNFVKRRAKHEPLQYITGSASFYNVEIDVSPAVLIPRSETEELVERILLDHDEATKRVLDIGTGSGCIAIAIAKERPSWEVHAVDLSEEALSVARTNATRNNTEVYFSKGDLFKLDASLPGKWDIIVSNPPYIDRSEEASLDPQVLHYEPSMALFCDNRESVYAHIADYAKSHLNTGGKLFLEIHLEHPIETEQAYQTGFTQVDILDDLSGRRRFVRARI